MELRPEGGEEEERVPGGGNSNLEGSWVRAVLHGLRVTWLGHGLGSKRRPCVFQLPQTPHPGACATLSSRPDTVPTSAGRPCVLNLLLLAIQNLLSGFMPLDPAIRGRQPRILKAIWVDTWGNRGQGSFERMEVLAVVPRSALLTRPLCSLGLRPIVVKGPTLPAPP